MFAGSEEATNWRKINSEPGDVRQKMAFWPLGARRLRFVGDNCSRTVVRARTRYLPVASLVLAP